MKIYTDANLTQEVQNLDFGIVNAGESKIYEFYLFNDSKAQLRNLKFNILHPEVEIMSAPMHLDRGQKDLIKVEWKPSITLKQGLKAKLSITGEELWEAF